MRPGNPIVRYEEYEKSEDNQPLSRPKKRIIDHSLFTATHSMISTYFGSITIVLKFPLTSAASAKGRDKYRGSGLLPPFPPGDGGADDDANGSLAGIGKFPGVGERF